MNGVVLLAVLASYALSQHPDVSGYVALSDSRFQALENPIGQFGVRYALRVSDRRSVALFYDHLSSLEMDDDGTGLNRVGLLYRQRLDDGWEFFTSAGVRNRHFDHDRLRGHNTFIMDVGVERNLGTLGRFDASVFAAALNSGDTRLHSGLRVSY